MSSILEKINAFATKHKLREDLSWLNYISVILCGWLIAFHQPNGILFLCILFIPVLGFILKRQAGKKSLDDYIQPFDFIPFFDFYYIELFITIPSVALALRVFWDFEFESFYSLLIHVSSVFVVLISVCIISHKKITGSLQHKFTMYGLFSIVLFIYSYSAVYGINCWYDYSDPVQFETNVVNKRVEINKKKNRKKAYIWGKPGYSYKITIAPWGQHHEWETLDVTYEQYMMFDTGDAVYVDLQNGLFGIPWYHLDDKKMLHGTW